MRLHADSSPWWVAVGALISGSATYALLVVTARALGPAAYGEFSLFWAAIVITSLGLFLPVEQVLASRTARRAVGRAGSSELLRSCLRLSALLAGAAITVNTAIWLTLRGSHTAGVIAAVTVAFALAVIGFTLQFPARGILAGSHALRGYGLVIVVDSCVRATVVVGLWLVRSSEVGPYVAAVAVGSVASGVVGHALATRRTVRREASEADPPSPKSLTPASPVARLGREVGGLVVAMLGMQTLLNSGLIVAGTVSGGAAAEVAGYLLAAMTLARLPIFLAQSAQAAYVARVAAQCQAGDRAGLGRLLRLLGASVSTLGVGLVVAAAAFGPWAVQFVFGPAYAIDRAAAILVALGAAAYLVASVTNDVAVALSAHTRVGPSWIGAVITAAVVALTVPDLVLRCTLPILVGSLVATAALFPAVVAPLRPGGRTC